MDNFEIMADPELPYHYLLGVAVRDARCKDYGKLYLKYFLEFHHDDITRVRTALRLSKDKMFPSGISKSDAIDIAECRDIVGNISALRLSAAANNASVHHFSSSTKLDDSYFEFLVEHANKSKHNKKLLDDSRI